MPSIKNGRRPKKKWKTTSKKMEDDLKKNKKMEDDLKKIKWKTTSKKVEDDLKKQMADDLKKNVNGRQPQLKKSTLIGCDIIVN